MRMSSLRGLIAWGIMLSVLAGCGLATSEADRIARAEAQIADGEYRAAAIELKNVLAANGNNVTARLLLAKVSLGLGDIESAEKELQRAAELDAPEDQLRSLHSEFLLASRRYADLLAALGSEPAGLTDEQQFHYRGEALLGLGNHDAALETYEEWLRLDPAEVGARLGRAAKSVTIHRVRYISGLSRRGKPRTGPGGPTVRWNPFQNRAEP